MTLTWTRRHALRNLGLLLLCPPFWPARAKATEGEWVLGFGSCMSGRRSQNFWQAVFARRYDHWCFLGDALYPDNDNLEGLQRAYQELSQSSSLAALREQVSVSATWDDHDFGADNADSSLPFKNQSLLLFKNFWKQTYASLSDGVYSSRTFESQGRTIHLILLDLRFHRTAVEKNSSGGQLLGADQWAWFEKEMERPAHLKLIGSSIQVLASEHNFEKWANYPAEFDRLMAVVGRSTSPTVFLSGDRHFHEISKSQSVSGRTLYDFTSSGLNKADGLSVFERNRLRIERCLDDGFGEVRVQWEGDLPCVTLQMIDNSGNIRFSQTDTLI